MAPNLGVYPPFQTRNAGPAVKMRPGALPPTSPSCRRCCAEALRSDR